ncbi:SLATT domain-containing protein [Micromonospora zamorensis]|uniref:SLATT domain-containing protein n=1 Tax=Micromonospora zamorensis TaxID=709883 RepID=UPI00352AC4D7|nr:SLATT domain-containing protein [Micromonospora zamorensis]
MTIRPFPVLAAGQQQPDLVLHGLREWAEGQAEDSIAWYLHDKAVRRRFSRVLRGGAILLGIAGGVVPLVSAASAGSGASWGYVLLAMAGGCLAFDHFFGLSSAWMRDIATAQALQRALTEFRLDWAAAELGNATEDHEADLLIQQREKLIRVLVMRTAELVEAETDEWLSEFRSNIGDLTRRSGWSPSTAQPSADFAHSVDSAAKQSDVT